MERQQGFSGFGLFLAFLGGAAAGAGAALLLAPVTGKEARERLMMLASTGRQKVSRVPQALKSAYSQAAEAAKETFSETYREAGRRT